jgi:hypothetical protein
VQKRHTLRQFDRTKSAVGQAVRDRAGKEIWTLILTAVGTPSITSNGQPGVTFDEDLRREPIEERKATLARLLCRRLDGIVLNEHFKGTAGSSLSTPCRLGCEGIVSKRPVTRRGRRLLATTSRRGPMPSCTSWSRQSRRGRALMTTYSPIMVTRRPFKTLVGDVIFGAQGEWAESCVQQVQFQHIKGNDVGQFKDLSTEVVLMPAQYKSGEIIYPYEKAK